MDKVKIGCKYYNLIYSPRKLYMEDGQKLGICDYENVTISIWTKQGKSGQQETLLHEITHAILEERNLNKINTEEVVEPLSKGILAFLLDNKELIKEVIDF